MINTEADIRKRDEKHIMMTQMPVVKLVMRLAVPTTVSMVISAVYNLTDAYFVGKLSTEATAGIGISFAYMIFVQAIGFFFGHGSGNFISRASGAKKYNEAERMAAVGFFSTLIIGIITAVIGLIYIDELSSMLGATPQIKPYSNDYMRYIIIATPFMMSSLVMNNQLRLQGNAKFAMIGLAFGSVLNIVLDPIFIFVLDTGITGASVSTCISQILSWMLLLWGTRKNGNIHIRIRNFKPTLRRYKEVIKGGLPSLCRQVFNCSASICLNHAAVLYAGEQNAASTVGAFAVVSRVMMFAFSLILGVAQGFQPVCGFNYGAKLYKRVLESYLFTIKIATLILIILSVTGYIFASQIVGVFRGEDAMLIEVGARVMRWQCYAYPLIGISTVTGMLFQNIGDTFKASLISICRQGLFFVPLVWILPHFLGLKGVEMTQALSDILTFCLCLPFTVSIIKSLKLKSENENLQIKDIYNQ